MMALVLMVAAVRAVQLQAFDANAYAAAAAEQMQFTTPLPPTRGEITDRNGAVLASTEPAVDIIADPQNVLSNGADPRYDMSEQKKRIAAHAPQQIALILARHLGGVPEDYLPKLTKRESRYQVIAKQVPAYTYSKIANDMRNGVDPDDPKKKVRWIGITSESNPIRTYPAGPLASNVVGFVAHDDQTKTTKGLGGLEYAKNTELTGKAGKLTYDASPWGKIPLGTNVITPAVNGTSYELTIDSELQYMAQRALANAVMKTGAASGSLIAMDVKTGEVLVLANVPTFDPSNIAGQKPDNLGNRSIHEAYEPGSVQKVLTMAALTDAGLVNPDTRVEVPSRIASGSGFIGDAFSHGTLHLTARGVVANSSNIGTVKLTRDLPKAELSTYLKSFGLGQPTNIGLPGEAKGSVPGADMANYTRDQVSFGQGLSVTAIQMAAAVAGVVNGGEYHQPSVIRSATAGDGSAVELPAPATRRVISAESSAMVRDMMESVVTLKDSRGIPGYRTAGKTGTAQRFDPKCKCYNGYTASFVGVAPADDPQLLVYVVLDRPVNGHQGSEVALPVYQQVMGVALTRYGILPSSEPARKLPLTYQP